MFNTKEINYSPNQYPLEFIGKILKLDILEFILSMSIGNLGFLKNCSHDPLFFIYLVFNFYIC